MAALDHQLCRLRHPQLSSQSLCSTANECCVYWHFNFRMAQLVEGNQCGRNGTRDSTCRQIQAHPCRGICRPGGAVSFGWALQTYTAAYMPYLDAFAMSCAFTAQWMLSRKYIENWLCWIIADMIYIYLWGTQGYYVSVGLFSIFILLATKGWFEWKRSIRAQT